MIKELLMNKKRISLLLLFVMFQFGTLVTPALGSGSTPLQFKVYPSEIKEDYFTIHFDNNTESEVEVKVINLIGTEIPVILHKKPDGSYRVEFSNTPSNGIYIVRVTKGRDQGTQRVVVRHN
jgi:hypothetical protein